MTLTPSQQEALNTTASVFESSNTALAATRAELDAAKAQIADLTAQLEDCQSGGQPSPQVFAIGTSVPGGAAAVDQARTWGMGAIRVFFPAALPANMGANATTAKARAGETWIVSYKNAASQAALNTYVASWPAGVTLILCWHHEPENDTATLTPAVFRTTTATQIERVHAAGALYAIILMGYTFFSNSGRNPANWYVPGAEYLLTDSYNVGTDKGIYTEPAKITGPPSAWVKANGGGAVWGIAETGSPDLGTVAGQTRAEWARALVDSTQQAGGQILTWWNQRTGDGTKDYRLDDATAQALVAGAQA